MASGDLIANLTDSIARTAYGEPLDAYPVHLKANGLSLVKKPITSANEPLELFTFLGITNASLGASGSVTVRATLRVSTRPQSLTGNKYTGGGAVRLACIIKALAAGETVNPLSGGGTLKAVTVNLDATAGELVVASLVLSNAEADALAASTPFALQFGRDSIHEEDTCEFAVEVVQLYMIQT